MHKDKKTGLILPPSASVSRRQALKMGGFGIGGLTLGGSFLAACGSDEVAAPAATTAVTTAASSGLDSIKAHWVYIGPPDDNGWTQEHERGRLAAQAALGDKMESAFTPNIGFDAGTTQLFEQLAADGNDIIFANTEYASLLSGVAESNPDTKFVEANGHVFTDNEFGFYLAHESTAYLMGVAAAKLTPNGRIGYIGAFPTATAYNDVNGLLLGARSVNPDATVEAVMVSTFFDPQAAAQAANALLDNGVEFLFGVMDEPTFLQISEEAGVWTGYWNLDFREAAPTKYTAHYDLSAFGPFYTEQCQSVLDGTWSAPSEVVLLDTPLGEMGDEVPQDVKDAVATAAAAIADGSLNVYEGPLVDNTGTEQLAAGATIDALGAYELSFALEGVSGL
ncbi:MAG: basic membrane protein A [Verrucomicrobiales bacterium]|jgi:basic membrane protein A